ncbi:Beta-glucosidase BoGH3B [Linum perenne]
MKMGRASFLVLLALCISLLAADATATTGSNYLKYKDPKQPVGARIKDLLKRMTVEEKIGQMVQVDRLVASPDVMKKYFLGSVLSGGGSVPAPKATAEAWVNMVNGLQKGALSTRLGIPMIYGIDAVHGHNNVYKATIFPHNVGLGVTRYMDPQLIKKIGDATAKEVRATGIPYAFAPCIAVCRDPRWGRCYESYSEDHTIVQKMTEIIPGLQGDLPANSRKGVPFVDNGGTKVAACAKHYVGDGGTTKGINENNTGFVISDWQGVDRITSPPHVNYSSSITAGVSAGIDMVMVAYNYTEFIDILTYQVKKNIIPITRINDAVQRILRVKFIMGLFEKPIADYSMANEIGKQEHRDIAREAVRKSLVLLKNTGPMLPLPKHASRILVAGTHANNLGYQCGGWTISHQGLNGNNYTTGTTILSGITSTVDPTTEIFYHTNPPADFIESNNFSYAIVVVGEIPYAESQGDNGNLTIPEAGITAINNVCGWTKCVVVLVSGRPLVIQPYLPKITALVAAWLPGTEGQGIADVLYGDYGFTGKLPRTWFKSVSQLPMNFGDKNYDPLFPFGFGISTTAVHSDDS